MPFRIIFSAPGVAELQATEVPSPGSREVLLRSRVSLISTGTEITAFRHNFDAGTHWDAWVKYPFRPGYATVAQVEEVGADVRSVDVGCRVVVRAPHASNHVVDEDQITGVPDEISDEEAVWFALAKIAFTGILAADLRVGAKVAIIGAGPVGQMLTRWVAASVLADIIIVDRNESRLNLARLGGATAAIFGSLEKKRDAVLNALGGHQPHVVIDCTGNPGVLVEALQLTASRGKVVILGDTGFPALQRISSDVVLRGVSVIGAHDRHTLDEPRWNRDREIFRIFFRLASTGRFPMAGLVTHRFNPYHVQQAYSLAEESKGMTAGILFDWRTLGELTL